MIIKSFRKKSCQLEGFYGQNIDSWTQSWSNVKDLSGISMKTNKDNLSIFFKKYFPNPPKKILEGGCGTGKYVIAYRKMGYDILGVDFSGDMIKRIKECVDKDLPVYEGDVTTLPFDNGFFDCYFSGGVIEHFEEGPEAVIKEARRVLKKGGIFLVTVPYVNFLRRLNFSILPSRNRNGFFQKRCVKCKNDSDYSEEYNFCEYFFDVSSLTRYFKDNGFLIEKTYPTDFLWGELGLLLHRYIKNFQGNAYSGVANKVVRMENKKSFVRNLIYDFLVTENRNNIFFRPLLDFLNYLSGHMILFVARAV